MLFCTDHAPFDLSSPSRRRTNLRHRELSDSVPRNHGDERLNRYRNAARHAGCRIADLIHERPHHRPTEPNHGESFSRRWDVGTTNYRGHKPGRGDDLRPMGFPPCRSTMRTMHADLWAGRFSRPANIRSPLCGIRWIESARACSDGRFGHRGLSVSNLVGRDCVDFVGTNATAPVQSLWFYGSRFRYCDSELARCGRSDERGIVGKHSRFGRAIW